MQAAVRRFIMLNYVMSDNTYSVYSLSQLIVPCCFPGICATFISAVITFPQVRFRLCGSSLLPEDRRIISCLPMRLCGEGAMSACTPLRPGTGCGTLTHLSEIVGFRRL